jgi:hypothetical protein
MSPALSHVSAKINSGDLPKAIGNEDVRESPEANNSACSQKNTAARQDAPPFNIDEIVWLCPSEQETPVYSEPSSKGEVLYEWHALHEMYGDSTPILNESDNSSWYRVRFEGSTFGFTISQVHKLPKYNYSYGYVDAKSVTAEPLPDIDKEYLEWIRDGKPPTVKVGDLFEEMRDTIGVTKVPLRC